MRCVCGGGEGGGVRKRILFRIEVEFKFQVFWKPIDFFFKNLGRRKWTYSLSSLWHST